MRKSGPMLSLENGHFLRDVKMKFQRLHSNIGAPRIIRNICNKSHNHKKILIFDKRTLKQCVNEAYGMLIHILDSIVFQSKVIGVRNAEREVSQLGSPLCNV